MTQGLISRTKQKNKLGKSLNGHIDDAYLAVPEVHLTLRSTSETDSNKFASVTEPAAARRLDTHVRGSLSDERLFTDVEDAELLVLAGSSQELATGRPGHRLDVVTMAFELEDLLGLFDVPDADGSVSGRRGKDVAGLGMVGESTDLLLMTAEGNFGLGDVLGDTLFRDSPDLNGAVLGSRG